MNLFSIEIEIYLLQEHLQFTFMSVMIFLEIGCVYWACEIGRRFDDATWWWYCGILLPNYLTSWNNGLTHSNSKNRICFILFGCLVTGLVSIAWSTLAGHLQAELLRIWWPEDQLEWYLQMPVSRFTLEPSTPRLQLRLQFLSVLKHFGEWCWYNYSFDFSSISEFCFRNFSQNWRISNLSSENNIVGCMGSFRFFFFKF